MLPLHGDVLIGATRTGGSITCLTPATVSDVVTHKRVRSGAITPDVDRIMHVASNRNADEFEAFVGESRDFAQHVSQKLLTLGRPALQVGYLIEEGDAALLDDMTKEWASGLSDRIEQLQVVLPGSTSSLQEHMRLSFAKPHSAAPLALTNGPDFTLVEGGFTVGPAEQERLELDESTTPANEFLSTFNASGVTLDTITQNRSRASDLQDEFRGAVLENVMDTLAEGTLPTAGGPEGQRAGQGVLGFPSRHQGFLAEGRTRVRRRSPRP